MNACRATAGGTLPAVTIAAPLLALAVAGPPAPAIEWSAPPGCPGRVEILEQAARLVGRPALDELPSEVSIRGHIHREPSGFMLRMELESPTGVTHKRVSAEGCAVLGSVAALMVAVTLDPVGTTVTLPSEGSTPPREPIPSPVPEALPAPTRAPAPRPARQPIAAPAPSPREPSFVEGMLRASGGVGRGLVPGLDGMVSLGGGVRTRRLRAELVAFHVLSQAARYPDRPTVGANVAAWGGSLRAGPAFERGAFEVSTRAGVSVAALVANGFGVLDPNGAASAWIALCFVPGLRWQPGPRWAVGVDVEGEVALRRPAFSLDALSSVYRASPVNVRGAIVLELRLGARER